MEFVDHVLVDGVSHFGAIQPDEDMIGSVLKFESFHDILNIAAV
ncbi:hypothetical protein [Cryobacterium sp. 10C3]|nr:hypothetical protein [Cryobacterium sp. 10C3]MDY7557598.1 hypothetical protein [Cryobacterium sp. 10C3]